MLPLQALDANLRAEVLDRLSANELAKTVVNNVTLTFFAPSTLLRSRAANVATKEPDMLSWLDGLQADDVLWDVGANVGVFSLYAAVHRRCRVVAFEPAAANYFVLTRNLQLNGVTDRVTAYCLALSGETGLGTLNLDSADCGAAMSQFGSIGEASRYSGRPATLSHGMVGITADDFIARFDALRPTYLKMDVDGLEWSILQGATAVLADRRLRSIMVELSITRRDERQRAIEFLEARGLRLIGEGQPQGTTEQAANHLFVRA
jgi:FkbM family methyltransferase